MIKVDIKKTNVVVIYNNGDTYIRGYDVPEEVRAEAIDRLICKLIEYVDADDDYGESVEDMRSDLEDAEDEIRELERENRSLTKELKELKNKYDLLCAGHGVIVKGS